MVKNRTSRASITIALVLALSALSIASQAHAQWFEDTYPGFFSLQTPGLLQATLFGGGFVDGHAVGLAREVATEGIRVNAVSPGLISTELHAAAGAPDRTERLAPTVPMKRAGTAEEVAEGIVWLLSPAAAYVTGVILPISGGR